MNSLPLGGLDVAPADLTHRNTLALPSRARAWLALRTVADLPAVRAAVRRHGRSWVLGGGSNLVLPPVVDELVIEPLLTGVRIVPEGDDAVVEAGAGEVWHDLVTHCLAAGWHGLENLALIPGRVGAAPVQNIGAYGVELAQRFHSAEVVDMRSGARLDMTAADCAFGYRDSVFRRAEPGRWLILRVRLKVSRRAAPVLDYPDLRALADAGGPVSARAVYDTVCAVRRAKLPDPAQLPNAGSFFKNPLVDGDQYAVLRRQYPGLVAYGQPDGRYKLAAAWLIDQAGWKGRRLGPVGMHERQALVLVNHGGATAADVRALAHAVQADVHARYGVALEPEPIFIGAGLVEPAGRSAQPGVLQKGV